LSGIAARPEGCAQLLLAAEYEIDHVLSLTIDEKSTRAVIRNIYEAFRSLGMPSSSAVEKRRQTMSRRLRRCSGSMCGRAVPSHWLVVCASSGIISTITDTSERR